MTDAALTPSRLWKRISPELRQQAATAFWLDEEATDDQVQAVLAIAQQKKFRPKFVLGLDTDRKARHLATLGSLPDTIAARVLIVAIVPVTTWPSLGLAQVQTISISSRIASRAPRKIYVGSCRVLGW